MDEADRLADRVAIIDHGHLLVLDTPEALKGRLGQGDVLEINLNGQATQAEVAIRALVQEGIPAVLDASHALLTVRALNTANLLPPILEALASAGVQPSEIRLRANTLEDVFLQLTGRTLRE
jgi:ABC-2 type transport system ATP-binding protein